MITLDQRNQRANLAVFGLLGSVKSIAADRFDLGAESMMRHLREALAKCEAELRAIEHPCAD